MISDSACVICPGNPVSNACKSRTTGLKSYLPEQRKKQGKVFSGIQFSLPVFEQEKIGIYRGNKITRQNFYHEKYFLYDVGVMSKPGLPEFLSAVTG